MTTGQTWQELCTVAVLESDWSRIKERIDAAESAIKGRLLEFSLNHGGKKTRRFLDAINKLSLLRVEVRSWQASKRAS